MTEIEKAYREGFHDCERRHLNEDEGWSASTAKMNEEKLICEIIAQRKIVREASEKLKGELNR